MTPNDDPATVSDATTPDGEPLETENAAAVHAELREPEFGTGERRNDGGLGWLAWTLLALTLGAIGGAFAWIRRMRFRDHEPAAAEVE